MKFTAGPLFGFGLIILLTASASYAASTHPDISVNALVLARANSEGDDRASEAANGIHLQEAELRFASNVDADFRAEARSAFHREPASPFEFHPEEVFVETLSLSSVTLRAGKYKAFLD